jgi:DNA-binding beta-propeller fold protein YncE
MSDVTSIQSDRKVVLGSAPYAYEVVAGWGELPNNIRFGYTHGVQVDSQNRVIVHNQSKDSVILFDDRGKYIQSWGPEFQNGAHGCLLRKESGTEYLYLSDYDRHIVVKTTLDGETIWTIQWPEESGLYKDKTEFKPTNVAVAPNGDIYVTDGYGLSYIHHYNSKLELIRSWGGKGKQAGELDCPHGIWVDLRSSPPILIVADRGNSRLQTFTLDGKHLAFFSEAMRMPCHFDQNRRNGDLLVPDLHGVVTICGKDNRPVVQLGDNYGIWQKPGWPNFPRDTWEAGKFITPHAACWDLEENIYVVEWIAEGRVTKLRKF